MNESAKKASGHVSDFNCSDHVCQNEEEHFSNTNSFGFKDNIINNNSATNRNQNQSLGWTI